MHDMQLIHVAILDGKIHKIVTGTIDKLKT